MSKSYKNVVAWQRAHEFALKVFELTKRFPREDRFEITSQLRRAALSVPTNIVEGTARQGSKELKNFLNIAIGSLAEAEYLLQFCKDVGYLEEENYLQIEKLRQRAGLPLWNFYKSIG